MFLTSRGFRLRSSVSDSEHSRRGGRRAKVGRFCVQIGFTLFSVELRVYASDLATRPCANCGNCNGNCGNCIGNYGGNHVNCDNCNGNCGNRNDNSIVHHGDVVYDGDECGSGAPSDSRRHAHHDGHGHDGHGHDGHGHDGHGHDGHGHDGYGHYHGHDGTATAQPRHSHDGHGHYGHAGSPSDSRRHRVPTGFAAYVTGPPHPHRQPVRLRGPSPTSRGGGLRPRHAI